MRGGAEMDPRIHIAAATLNEAHQVVLTEGDVNRAPELINLYAVEFRVCFLGLGCIGLSSVLMAERRVRIWRACQQHSDDRSWRSPTMRMVFV